MCTATKSCGGEYVLHVVRDCKHLGTRTAAAGHMGPEVSAKTAISKQAVSSMRRRLFAKEAIPAERRLQYGRMPVLSKGFSRLALGHVCLRRKR